MNHPQVAYRNTKKLICYLAINNCPNSARKLMLDALDNSHQLISGLLLWLQLLEAAQLANWISATTS